MSVAKYVGALVAAAGIAGAANAQYGPNGRYPVGPQPVYPSVFWSTNLMPAPYGTPLYTYPGTVRTGGFAGRAYTNGGYYNRGFNNGGYSARPSGWNTNGGGRRGWYR